MTRISLCLIARDEAALLPRCLASARAIADEIVLVDTGSTDGTIAIAEAAGARVSSFAWADDFAAARNASLARATGDFILVLDADEALAPEGAEAIRAAIADGHDAWLLTVENQMSGGGPPQTARLIRLFRNLPGLRFRGRLHEQLTDAIERLGLRVGGCGARVLHEGYTEALVAARDKHARNLRLLDLMLAEDPADLYARYQRGRTLAAMGRDDEAAVAFREALDGIREHPAARTFAFHAALHLRLAGIVERRSGPKAAIALLREGVRALPEDPQIRLRLGMYLRMAGDEGTALAEIGQAHALAAVEVPDGVDRARVRVQAAEIAAEIWGRRANAALVKGDLDGAARACESQLEFAPENFAAQVTLGTIHFERGRFERSLVALEAAERLRPGVPDVGALAHACRRKLGRV